MQNHEPKLIESWLHISKASAVAPDNTLNVIMVWLHYLSYNRLLEF